MRQRFHNKFTSKLATSDIEGRPNRFNFNGRAWRENYISYNGSKAGDLKSIKFFPIRERS